MATDWFKVGVGYYRDPALVRAGEAAEVFFLRCLSYCAENDTKGTFPKESVWLICPVEPQPRIEALVRENVLIRHRNDYEVRSWNKWQEHLDALQERRRTDRERKAKERAAKAAIDAQTATSPPTVRGNVTGQSDGPSADFPQNPSCSLDGDGEKENSQESSFAREPELDDDPTSQLLVEHVAAYSVPPPLDAQHKAKLAIQKLVAEKVPAARIRSGLERLRERNVGPALLPQMVTEATPTRSQPKSVIWQ